MAFSVWGKKFFFIYYANLVSQTQSELTFIQVPVLLMLSTCLQVHPFCTVSLHWTRLKALRQGLMGAQTAVRPRSTAHFVTAGDLHPDEVGDGGYHVGDVLKQQKNSLKHMNSLLPPNPPFSYLSASSPRRQRA